MSIMRTAVRAANAAVGPKVTIEALDSRLQTPRVQIRVLMEQIQKEPDKTKRQVYIDKLNKLKAVLAKTSILQVPLGARGSVVQEEIQPPR